MKLLYWHHPFWCWPFGEGYWSAVGLHVRHSFGARTESWLRSALQRTFWWKRTLVCFGGASQQKQAKYFVTFKFDQDVELPGFHCFCKVVILRWDPVDFWFEGSFLVAQYSCHGFCPLCKWNGQNHWVFDHQFGHCCWESPTFWCPWPRWKQHHGYPMLPVLERHHLLDPNSHIE